MLLHFICIGHVVNNERTQRMDGAVRVDHMKPESLAFSYFGYFITSTVAFVVVVLKFELYEP